MRLLILLNFFTCLSLPADDHRPLSAEEKSVQAMEEMFETIVELDQNSEFSDPQIAKLLISLQKILLVTTTDLVNENKEAVETGSHFSLHSERAMNRGQELHKKIRKLTNTKLRSN